MLFQSLLTPLFATRSPFPVAYNGDIFSCADKDTLVKAYPETRHIMLGRGILANPALARMLIGGKSATRDELICFHNQLFRAYEREMGGNAIFRMKEWWHYAKFNFSRPLAVHRAIRKTRTVAAYLDAVDKVFSDEKLADIAVFADSTT